MSSDLLLPRCKIEFKFVRELEGAVEWEVLPNDQNHLADLSNHMHVKVMVQEGELPANITVQFLLIHN